MEAIGITLSAFLLKRCAHAVASMINAACDLRFNPPCCAKTPPVKAQHEANRQDNFFHFLLSVKKFIRPPADWELCAQYKLTNNREIGKETL